LLAWTSLSTSVSCYLNNQRQDVLNNSHKNPCSLLRFGDGPRISLTSHDEVESNRPRLSDLETLKTSRQAGETAIELFWSVREESIVIFDAFRARPYREEPGPRFPDHVEIWAYHLGMSTSPFLPVPPKISSFNIKAARMNVQFTTAESAFCHKLKTREGDESHIAQTHLPISSLPSPAEPLQIYRFPIDIKTKSTHFDPERIANLWLQLLVIQVQNGNLWDYEDVLKLHTPPRPRKLVSIMPPSKSPRRDREISDTAEPQPLDLRSGKIFPSHPSR
jgi:hypothetical protein